MLSLDAIKPLPKLKISLDEFSINWFYFIFLLHAFMAYVYQGYSNVDEHFQILELASYKLHHFKFSYPWELQEKIRPTIQIWSVIGLHNLFPKASPFQLTYLTRFFSGTLSAYACYLFIATFQNEFKNRIFKHWLLLLSIFSYIALYQSVHFSSENISGHLFLIGFCKLYKQNKHTFLLGFILGLAFIVRYQSGFLIFGFLLWLLIKHNLSIVNLFKLVSGILIIILIGIVLDSYFYGTLTLTSWNYFYSNIVLHKANNFGVSLWSYSELAYLLPFGPCYLVGILYFLFKYRQHPISWTILPFIFIHQIIPHKELRFLWPILSFMPFTWMYCLQDLSEKLKLNMSSNSFLIRLNQLAWYINNGIVILLAILSYKFLENYQFLWNHFENKTFILNKWTEDENLMPKNAVIPKMPLRYYLNTTSITQQFNDKYTYQCNKDIPCIIWLPCFKEKLNFPLLYDSCPTMPIYQLANFNNWKNRAEIYREKGRLYEIL